jgi:hypothetical protein
VFVGGWRGKGEYKDDGVKLITAKATASTKTGILHCVQDDGVKTNNGNDKSKQLHSNGRSLRDDNEEATAMGVGGDYFAGARGTGRALRR